MTAAEASLFTIVIGAIQLPLGLLGGKLADQYNSENCIIVVIFTPIITHLFTKLFQTKKIVGIILVLVGYIGFWYLPCWGLQ